MVNPDILSAIPEAFQPLARMLNGMNVENDVYEGNSFEIITCGSRKRELLLEDIRQAKSFIHIEYFRFGNDKAGREVRNLLIQKAKEGVEVRFLNNNWSGVVAIPNAYWKPLIQAGAEIIPFTHIKHGLHKWFYRIFHQQHRKIVVIDGQVAYTGGMNLNDNYFFKWRDTHLRMTGPIVTALNESFMDSWRASGGRFSYPPEHYLPDPVALDAPFTGKTVQLVSDSPETQTSAMLETYEWVLDHARDYVYIQTPYFVPPPSFIESLTKAARRGVDVRVMLPMEVDTPFFGTCNRSYYTECLSAGVRIVERGGEFIHSKTLVSDDAFSIIGASNLDWRSFHVNYEINTLIYDRETALYNKTVFEEDRELVKEWRLKEWLRGRKWYHAAISWFVHWVYRLL